MPTLLPVEDAIRRIVAGVVPLSAERLAVATADGRVLAESLVARRSQPPFDASAMDGFAVRAVDAAARLKIVGTSAAGKRYAQRLNAGEAIRIYTGAPVPENADGILIQENATVDGATVIANTTVVAGRHIRRAGYDFRTGDAGPPAGADLGMREVALAAAFGYGEVAVRRRPRVAIIATGDELVPPGTVPGPDQIVATNALAVEAHVRACGGVAHDLGIAGDTIDAIAAAVDGAIALDADVIVTIGGASVGDHDLVRPALARRGVTVDFWRIAMRPGKPMMFGTVTNPAGRIVRVLALPGNPASSIVCSLVFLAPLIDALLGRPPRDRTEPAVLTEDMPANDERRDYLRARVTPRDSALPAVSPLRKQDSGMLSALAIANCLLVRPPNASPAKAGDVCRILPLA